MAVYESYYYFVGIVFSIWHQAAQCCGYPSEHLLTRNLVAVYDNFFIDDVIHNNDSDGLSQLIYITSYVALCFHVFSLLCLQIAYSLIEEQEGRKRLVDDYISFVGLLADPRYCGISSFFESI